jgi:glycosyltransferase involved in cell wall biosynthesis
VSPAVSVVIPTCNSDRFIASTLASVCRQTISDFEIVVADAASTDSTLAIVAEVAAVDPRVRCVELTERTPPPATRNAALAVVDAPAVALLDADDQMYPDRLERQLAALEASDVAVVGGPLDIVDDHGVRAGRAVGSHLAGVSDMAIRFTMAFGSPTLTSGLCIPTETLRAVGGFDESQPWSDDYPLCVRLLEQGQIVMLDAAVGSYRRHPQSVSLHQRDRQNLEVVLLRRDIVAKVLGRRPDLATILAWSFRYAEVPETALARAILDLDDYVAAFVGRNSLVEADRAFVEQSHARRRAAIEGRLGSSERISDAGAEPAEDV